MKPLDPITYVDGGLLVHVRLDGLHTTDDYVEYITTRRRGLAGDIDGPRLKISDESATWCRGHVTPDDEAGAALLAAAAMKATAIDLETADVAFLHGDMTVEAWKRNLDLWDAEFDAGERDR